MMNIRKITGPILLATTLLVGRLALAADAKKPSGTVSIDETQFAFILGGSVGGGMLTFHGKEYPFKIGGITAGAAGSGGADAIGGTLGGGIIGGGGGTSGGGWGAGFGAGFGACPASRSSTRRLRPLI